MQTIPDFITKHPLSVLMMAAIWVLCLLPVPETPLSSVTLIDKWVHIVMYLVLSATIAIEHKKSYGTLTVRSSLVYVWLLPIAMGGLIELAQAYCTHGNRSGEWLDFVADAVGASLVAVVTCILRVACRAKG